MAHTGRSRDGYAERVVVGADGLVPIPDGVSYQQAAALVHDGVTGGALVDEQRVGAGDRVLVVGASGGLGIVLVQLARARGARVVALARDERKLARVRALGADAVIDSDAPDWTARARAALGGDGADVVFDNVGGDLGEAASGSSPPAAGSPPTAPRAAGSRRSPRKTAAARDVTVRGIRDVQLAPAERRRLTEQAMAAAAAGGLRPVIGQTFPLAQADRAHAAIEDRSVFGSTLLIVAADTSARRGPRPRLGGQVGGDVVHAPLDGGDLPDGLGDHAAVDRRHPVRG